MNHEKKVPKIMIKASALLKSTCNLNSMQQTGIVCKKAMKNQQINNLYQENNYKKQKKKKTHKLYVAKYQQKESLIAKTHGLPYNQRGQCPVVVFPMTRLL